MGVPTFDELPCPTEVRTVDDVFAVYLKAKFNPYAAKKCKHPSTLWYALLKPRALWGSWEIDAFRKGSVLRIETQVAEWRKEELCANTVRKRIVVMKAAFRYCVNRELIERGQEPVMHTPPAGLPRERTIESGDELERLIRAVEDPRTPFHIRLTFYTLLIQGPRVGALLDLQWPHVDFVNRVVCYRDTEDADERSQKKRINQPMNDFIYGLFLEAKERARTPYCVEFRNKRVTNIRTGLKALYKRAGVTTRLTIHDLRRTSATRVHKEMDGNMSKAAAHIGDSEAMARKHYVNYDDPMSRLDGVNAVTDWVERAKKSAA